MGIETSDWIWGAEASSLKSAPDGDHQNYVRAHRILAIGRFFFILLTFEFDYNPTSIYFITVSGDKHSCFI